MVALVGRPNVGKSTLFNRLAGKRLAVVDDIPGTTRDRLMTEAEWIGNLFDIVDTGGIDPTQVRKGKGRQPLSIGSADFIPQIRAQAEVAIKEADTVLFLVDVESGVTPADREVAQILRSHQQPRGDELFPPVLLVVNKCDSEARRQQALEFYEIGMGEPYVISALHGQGIGDLLDGVVASFETLVPDEFDEEDDQVKIAIVGKPNVGKSSLLNRILGEERSIVSPIAGTTRDAVDSYVDYEGEQITLIDTAGIRRRGKVEPGVEKYSVLRAMQAINRAHVALLLIDATSHITSQDTHIAGHILDAWKSTVVVVNKWDAIEKDSYTMNEYTKKILYELNFMDYVPLLFISALTGQRVERVIPTAMKVQKERLVRIKTSELNRILARAQERHPTPSKAGRHLKMYYATQVRSDPPTFMIYVNEPELMHYSYLRYLENRMREAYPFLGTPIRLVLKKRS